MTDWKSLADELVGMDEAPPPPDLKLPTLPTAVNEFSERARSDEASPKELGAIIETDAGLSVDLLRYVNSPACGLRREVRSASHAIALLGIGRVKLFVLTAAVQRMMSSKDSKLINAKVFWRTNLERAVFTRHVARLMQVDEDVAYSAGMLQDLLLPALTGERLDEYVEFSGSEPPVELLTFERARFGWNHARAAALLTRNWDLPDDLVCCIGWHHLGLRVLQDRRFARTPVAAVAIGALVPEPFRQVPGGFDDLVRLQRAWPAFDLASLAESVSADLEELGADGGDRSPFLRMVERLSRETPEPEVATCP